MTADSRIAASCCGFSTNAALAHDASGQRWLRTAPGRCIGDLELHDDAERLACYDAEFGKPTAAVPTPASESAEKDFGLAAHGTPQQAEIATVTSVVAAVARKRDGRFLVTLANGQRWEQSELESKASVEAGDTVTVRRASFGSFLIVTKAGIATRVKRVK